MTPDTPTPQTPDHTVQELPEAAHCGLSSGMWGLLVLVLLLVIAVVVVVAMFRPRSALIERLEEEGKVDVAHNRHWYAKLFAGSYRSYFADITLVNAAGLELT